MTAFTSEMRAVLSELVAMYELFKVSAIPAVREGGTNMILLRIQSLIEETGPLHQLSDEALLAWITRIHDRELGRPS